MPSVILDGVTIESRIIFDYELIYLEKGTFTLLYNGMEHNCTEGDFILIRPGASHSFICDSGDISQPHIHFDMSYTKKSEERFVCYKDYSELTGVERELVGEDIFADYPSAPFIRFSNADAALQLFFAAIGLHSDGKVLPAKAALTELLSIIVSNNFPDALAHQKNAGGDVCVQIKDFIDSRRGVGINLEALEKQFSYNKFHLEKQFSKKYGVGIVAYADGKRFEYACELLSSNTVSGAASLLGFSSIYSFSRAFKNKFGVSPTEYKKRSLAD